MPEKQRFGIDGYNMALKHGTGVATYGRALTETLQRAGHWVEGIFGIDAGRDPVLRETIFFDAFGNPIEPTRKQARAAARGQLLKALNPMLTVHAVDIPVTGRVDLAPISARIPEFDAISTVPGLFGLAMRHFGIYGRFLPVRMTSPPAIMHWTYPVPITLAGSRNIYTLHDLVPLRLPYTTLDQKADYRALVAECIRSGDRICTVSEASRGDILREFGARPDKIVNTWQASPIPQGATSAQEDAAAIEGIFGLQPQGYFLFLGAIEPKKNVGRLLEAYLSLSSDTPLVIVGGRGWQSEQELTLLPQEGDDPDIRARMGERVRKLSHLPRPLLLKLIRGARAVLFPSVAEGFGLPVLEAMQLGVPVLTSNVSSLPEIAGGAALLVDPYDVVSIATGIAALDRDADLRCRLAAAGPVRAAFFSEARYVSRLKHLYESGE